jgi:hypothetical protein
MQRDEVPTKSVVSSQDRARKSLILQKNTNEHDFISDSDDDLDLDDNLINKDKPKLSLDRFLQKQKETVGKCHLKLGHTKKYVHLVLVNPYFHAEFCLNIENKRLKKQPSPGKKRCSTLK